MIRKLNRQDELIATLKEQVSWLRQLHNPETAVSLRERLAEAQVKLEQVSDDLVHSRQLAANLQEQVA